MLPLRMAVHAPQVDDDDAHVVAAAARQRRLAQRAGGPLRVASVERDSARLAGRRHIPQTV